MCFSLAWLQQIFILAIVVIAIVAMLKLLVPYVLGKLGATIGEGMGVVIACLRILLWAVVAIIVVIIVFALISCLWSYTGGLGAVMPRRSMLDLIAFV